MSKVFNRKWLVAPYLFWAIAFILIPLGMVFYYGLTDKTGTFTLANILAIASPEHRKALGLSLLLSLISTVICLLLAYPLAMILTKLHVNQHSFIIVIFILPMWMNFLLRTLAWQTLLEKTGVINSVLGFLHLPALNIINTPYAIVLGMVYNFLPFMVLPLYNVLSKIDPNVINAAKDLGANEFHTFMKVILPLSVPGIISGITMVFVPSVSTFAISKMLGGGTEMLLGDLIEQQYMGGAYNPYLGAAISLVMMVIVVICMVVMNRFGEGEEQAVMM